MRFLLIPLAVFVVNRTIQLLIHSSKKLNRSFTLSDFFWAAGPPSSHVAALSSVVYLIAKYDGLGPLFGFSVIVSIMVIHELVKSKERAKFWDEKNADKNIKASDTNGHNFFDILTGALLGILLTILLNSI